jgi:hypothetical protein
MSLILLILLIVLLIAALERNRRRQLYPRDPYAGSRAGQDRDVERVAADLRAAADRKS